jgi:NitT/TauT family transport system substrate-binding protein
MIETLVSHDLGKIGCMSDARWKELGEQLRSVNFLPPGFDVKQAYDRTLVPGC